MSIDAKRTVVVMNAGEFSERHGDGVIDEGREQEAENDAGAGDLHGGGGAEKEACADRSPDGNHGHLSGAELVAKSLFRRASLGHEYRQVTRKCWNAKEFPNGMTIVTGRGLTSL